MNDSQLSIRDELKRLLIETLELDVAPAQSGDDEPLFEPGLGVDSVNAVEERLDVEIPDDELGLAMFQDLRSLAEELDRLASRTGDAA